jgi:selenide,water dikinase
MKAMTTSASVPSIAMQRAGASACTDVTGFGLLGHAYEMARASNVCLNIDSASVPLMPNVLNLIEQGMITRGDKNNRVYVGDTVEIGNHVSNFMQSALFDPQTAGGLLISIAQSSAEDLKNEIEGSVIIGTVQSPGEFLIRVN